MIVMKDESVRDETNVSSGAITVKLSIALEFVSLANQWQTDLCSMLVLVRFIINLYGD